MKQTEKCTCAWRYEDIHPYFSWCLLSQIARGLWKQKYLEYTTENEGSPK